MYAIDTDAIDGIEGIPPEQKQILKSQLIAQQRADMAVYQKELTRYKQDCRKRALDLAHSENTSSMMRAAASTATLSGGKIDVLALANKYYEWLTKDLS